MLNRIGFNSSANRVGFGEIELFKTRKEAEQRAAGLF